MGSQPSFDVSSTQKQVLICQNKTCRRAKAQAVLAAFQAHHLPDWEIVASSCLGQCGNGPMVLILPEQVWYGRVHPDEVPAIVDRHLRGGVPIQAMLYRKVHSS
jgi:(2Fe-2S) ferredoxin